MTAIAPNANAAAAAQFSGVNYSGALTPDALLIYCQSRLSGFDTQMQDEFKKQDAYNTATAALNDAQKALQSNPTGISPEAGQAVLADYQKAIDALPDGDEKGKIQTLKDQFDSELKTDPPGATADQAKWYADQAGDYSKELGSSAELDMMTLQSMMSQRQTAVQMCTNMLGALGDTTKGIAEKVGS